MAEVLLEQGELQELQMLQNIVQQKKIEGNMLEAAYFARQKEVMAAHGLDADKKYRIDSRGVVKEIENERLEPKADGE